MHIVPKLADKPLNDAPDSTTKKVLSYVASDHDDDNHEEEMGHVDERWLVSYADMMTLLFGLFVMLYSMANKFDKVQQQVAKTFNDKKATAPLSGQKPVLDLNDTSPENTKKMIEELKKVTAEKEKVEQELAQQLAKLPQLIDPSKAKESDVITVAKIKVQLDHMTRERDDLKAEIAKLKSQVAPLETAKVEKESIQKQLAQDEVKIQALQQEAAKEAMKEINQRAFVSVIIRWPTQNHDIDLAIEDPSGKTFNFKNRKFPNHPGQFTLDTRRGPGAEIWQAEEIIPGTYKIKYLFYNQYGNKSPTVVSGTVYTSKGAFDLPDTPMAYDKNRTATYTFQVDKSGTVQFTPPGEAAAGTTTPSAIPPVPGPPKL